MPSVTREASPASFEGIALDALQAARNAQATADRAIAENLSHEEICALRYTTINTEIGRIRSIIIWVGTSAFTIVIALLAFLGKAQYDSLTELKTAATQAAYQRAELRQQINQMPPRLTIQTAPGQSADGATIERVQQ